MKEKVEINGKNRDELLDIAKYIAIFLVIWGHVVQYSFSVMNNNINLYGDTLFKLINTMHMPLFMYLCGYFFSKSIKKRLNYNYKNLCERLKSLIYPMLVFGTLQMLIFGINNNVSILRYIIFIKDVWFLGSLTMNTLILFVVIKYFNQHLYLGIIISSVLTIFPYAPQGIFMYIFFCLGYITDTRFKNILESKFIKKYRILFIFLFIGFYIIYNICDGRNFIINFLKYGIIYTLVNDILKMILGFLGIYIILIVSLLIKKYKYIAKYLSERGKFTLEIYLLNIIFLEMILGKNIYPYIVEKIGYNIIINNGLFFEGIITFILSCLIIEILIKFIKLIYKNKKISILLFYKFRK